MSSRQYDTQQEKADALVRENVVPQLANIRTHLAVALAISQDRLNLHGWVYNIENGAIEALDGNTMQFVPLEDNPQVNAT